MLFSGENNSDTTSIATRLIIIILVLYLLYFRMARVSKRKQALRQIAKKKKQPPFSWGIVCSCCPIVSCWLSAVGSADRTAATGASIEVDTSNYFEDVEREINEIPTKCKIVYGLEKRSKVIAEVMKKEKGRKRKEESIELLVFQWQKCWIFRTGQGKGILRRHWREKPLDWKRKPRRGKLKQTTVLVHSKKKKCV